MTKYRIKPLIRSEKQEPFAPIEVQGIAEFEKPEYIHDIKIEGEDTLIDIYVKYKSRFDVPNDYAEYKERPELFDEKIDTDLIVGVDEIVEVVPEPTEVEVLRNQVKILSRIIDSNLAVTAKDKEELINIGA